VIVVRKSSPSGTPGKRKEKVASLLKKIISEFIIRLGFKNIIITVTHLKITNDLKNCKIFVSVYPDNSEAEVLSKLRSEMKNLIARIKRQTELKFLPHFEFRIDEGVKKQQRVEEILKNI
jgi:ribosome-binding factor A